MQSLRRPALACALGLLLALGACSSHKATSGTTTKPPDSGDLIAQVASYDIAVGPPGRIIVGVQSADQRLLAFGTVTFRFSFLGTKATPITSPEPGPAVTAHYLPIPGTPDPPGAVSIPRLVSGAEARGLYAATAGFDRPGFWEVGVSALVDGQAQVATGAFEVLAHHVVPAPGDQAPRSNNLTMDAPADVPRAAIDSRAGSDGSQPIPDPELHATTVAAALDAGRPVVVVVSTPVYCTSRFCGPVTDMVQELAHTYGDRATFVHIEVYRDFQSTEGNKVINKAAAEWIYPDQAAGLNEPWLFLIGADGIITARFDNVVTKGELEPLLQALPVIP